MRLPRPVRSLLWIWIVPCLVIGVIGLASCKNNDTTTAPGAVANVTVNAPDSATSGQGFDVTVNATAVGVANVQNAHVNVTLPAPLTVTAVNPSPGETASFTASTASWDIGTLDSNTNSNLHLTVVGTLPAGSPGGVSATISATLTATGINAGDAVASDTVQINP